MGLPMATNLVKKRGHAVTGYDVFRERRILLEQAGGASGEPEEIFAVNDVVFLCLPTSELLRDTVEQIRNRAKPGTIIVDLGSTSPAVIRTLAPQVQEKAMHLLDSPVSGGETGAVAGTLALMCGGNRAVFDKVNPLLLCMGTSATYMGNSGCGSIISRDSYPKTACTVVPPPPTSTSMTLSVYSVIVPLAVSVTINLTNEWPLSGTAVKVCVVPAK